MTSTTYKAALLSELKTDIQIVDKEIVRSPHLVEVDLSFAALNHRDYWITQGLYPGINLPVVLGSDGSGLHKGKEVIINPNINWGDSDLYPANSYNILGLEHEGCFAQKVFVSEDKIHPKPAHLSLQEAAALPLAGMTAFRATFSKGQLKKGENLLVTGIGGGVAQMAVKFGLAIGANVFVTSSSQDKIEKAKALGVVEGFNYKSEGWDKSLKKGFGRMDVIVDGAGGEGFNQLISVAALGARITIYGGTAGKIGGINPAHIFFKQITIAGSTMASDTEFNDMVAFVNQYNITPEIDSIYELSDINEAIKYLRSGDHFGKVLVKCN